jgi:hypothetical protein
MVGQHHVVAPAAYHAVFLLILTAVCRRHDAWACAMQRFHAFESDVASSFRSMGASKVAPLPSNGFVVLPACIGFTASCHSPQLSLVPPSSRLDRGVFRLRKSACTLEGIAFVRSQFERRGQNDKGGRDKTGTVE